MENDPNEKQQEEDLVVTVESLAKIQDRHESESSDGGSSGKSDGPGGDGRNIPAGE